jgi:DNA-3-methyladenine glycosylase II
MTRPPLSLHPSNTGEISITVKLKMKSIVNPKDIKQLINTDKIFAFIQAEYGDPPGWTRPVGFITLSRIILEQQVSLASAWAHFLKLNGYLGEFIPSNILRLTDEEMRRCQISRQKSEYLRSLSAAILSGELNLEELSHQSETGIREQLTRIKGIGTWTTDIYLMFCLQSKDIFPAGDIAIINTVRELSSARTREEIITLSEKWKPLRSLAAYFFWHYYLRKRNRTAE